MLSHPGRVRQGNEDACAVDVDHGAFVVCDGVGGAAGGEIASQIAAEALIESLRETEGSCADRLARSVEAANTRVYQQARQNRGLRGMGTTLVALLMEDRPSAANPDGRAIWLANIGDSRCYRLRDRQLKQLTDDHSVVEEQVRAGYITRQQAELSPIRNVITRALGSESVVDADIHGLEAAAGDLYLLATDGLTRELTDEQIAAILLQGGLSSRAGELEGRVGTLCESLVDAANANGGGDNITCVLVYLH